MTDFFLDNKFWNGIKPAAPATYATGILTSPEQAALALAKLRAHLVANGVGEAVEATADEIVTAIIEQFEEMANAIATTEQM